MGGLGRWHGKSCAKCGGPLPCVPCKRKSQQAWANANRGRVTKQKAGYEARYPERVKASKRAYYERNKDLMKERSRARKTERRDEINAQYRKKYAENPLPFLLRARRRDIHDKSVGGQFTDADRCALFQIQRGLCANPFCAVDLGKTGFHADHKTPVSRGGPHSATNRQLLCPTCNHRKGALTNEEWLEAQRQESEAV